MSDERAQLALELIRERGLIEPMIELEIEIAGGATLFCTRGKDDRRDWVVVE